MAIPAETSRVQITIASRDTALRTVVLDNERITIGRAPQNQIAIDDPAISGEHAVIAMVHGDALLEDLDSTNGTKVNGQPVKKHFLQDGDVIELGRFTIHYMTSTVPKGADTYAQVERESREHEAIAAIRLMSGPSAGKEIILNKPVTTIGRTESQIVVITKRQGRYFIGHIEGPDRPKVNGKSVNGIDQILCHGDMISLMDLEICFVMRTTSL